ncbi:hypothetical protein ACG2LH_11985 [Zhouia sp. PK063]|uniref:hypothetical protein n=1 Tax=Zhouia sp. PK063 TaxID=3373602 RepID=UPI0037B426C6
MDETATNYEENLFLKADICLNEGRFEEGKEILEELLSEYPDYGRAHNHLGWIFSTRYADYKRAAYHYSLAMRFSPGYAPAHVNYAYLLTDTQKYDDAVMHIKNAFTVDGVNHAILYSELGRIYELKQNFLKAYKNYKMAVNKAFDARFIDEMKSNLERVKNKMSFMQKVKLIFA